MCSNKGPLVWVEVEMIENFRALDTVVILLLDTTGATGTICRRELLGWPGPNTEMREMAGIETVVGPAVLVVLVVVGSWK